MADIVLSLAMTPYDRVMPLISGEVKPDGIKLEYMGMPGAVPRVFYEQMKFKRYDLSEFSMSSYLRQRSIGWPYRMLPIFHNRMFSYSMARIRKDAGIRQDHPEDLKGKRIGIKDYQQSIGMWTRGIFEMEWGLKPEDMVWYQERGVHFSHVGASAEVGLKLPANVKLNYATTDINTMYAKSELDASVHMGTGSMGKGSGLDRKQSGLSGMSETLPLFSDQKAEAIRFFRKTGVYPPHHVTVIRESILDEHPWVAISLMEAFEEAKKIAIERLGGLPPTLMVFGLQYLREIESVFGKDPFPYGIKANAKAFDMAQTISVQQGLTPRKQPLDEIFPLEVIYREEML
jgi:4,5-dihydroxyphthalate decarboxylase